MYSYSSRLTITTGTRNNYAWETGSQQCKTQTKENRQKIQTPMWTWGIPLKPIKEPPPKTTAISNNSLPRKKYDQLGLGQGSTVGSEMAAVTGNKAHHDDPLYTPR